MGTCLSKETPPVEAISQAPCKDPLEIRQSSLISIETSKGFSLSPGDSEAPSTQTQPPW